MAEIKFSQLTTAAQLTNDDIFALAQMQGGSLSSVKTSMIAIANFLNTQVQYTTAYNTQAKTTAGAINELKQLISLIPQFSIEVVEELPTEDISDTTIYLVPADDPETGNYYEEYIHVNDAWELVGTTAVDLSAYYTKLEVDAKFSALATVATSGSYNDLTNKPDLSALMDVNETTFTNPYTKKIVPSGQFTEKLKKLIGASVVWNQLANDGDTSTETRDGVIFTKNSAGHWTLTGTPTNNNVFKNFNYTVNVRKFVYGHVYYAKKGTTVSGIGLYFLNVLSGGNAVDCTSGDAIFKVTDNTSTTNWVRMQVLNKQNVDIGTVNLTLQYFDLTAMFGSTIADYVYTLETQTAGSGIAWLKSYGFFIEDYYAYSANTIQSVSVSAKVNKDSEDTTISTVALDHTTLRGLFKLDANNNLYADGDEYPSDGSGDVKYAEVDLGSATWNNQGTYFWAYIPGSWASSQKPINDSTPFNGICSKYKVSYLNDTEDNIITRNSSGTPQIYVRDSSKSSMTGEQFKEAVTGIKLIYELTTPTTQSLTPYEKLQLIEQGGTEEFVDYGVEQGTRDVAIPAGNETAYGDNELVGKVVNYIND